jgi:hypothetical protein
MLQSFYVLLALDASLSQVRTKSFLKTASNQRCIAEPQPQEDG